VLSPIATEQPDQPRLGRWHEDRVVLVGDAAWCPMDLTAT
jgi:hypothetical protein